MRHASVETETMEGRLRAFGRNGLRWRARMLADMTV